MSNIIAARDLRAGQTIVWNDVPHLILDHSFNKTAMRGGIVKCKIKNLFTLSITTEDFTNKKLVKAIINKVEAIFSYSTQENLIFLNKETFEEIQMDKKKYEKECGFLEEGLELHIAFYEDQVLDILFPDIVSLSIKELIEDNTASEHKKAITKTGLTIFVPKFFKLEDKVTVNTADGKYKSR